MNNLNERIAYYRRKCALTQEELAEKCSVTPQAVSKWENGLTSPDISLLPRLAEVFGITTDELLGVGRPETAALATSAFDPAKAIMRLRVDSKEGDHVRMNLPLSVAKIVIQSGSINVGASNDALKNIDFDQIINLVNSGVIGKLVEVESADGDTVEIWVE
ncbi:MAG: helix-turn-helix domain-containing protein [Christensenellaceae bacterium]|nr:helix-turn-helix domain-containing protein [Christensenellaceae bacterium]